MTVRWYGFEIHPDTPISGQAMPHFPGREQADQYLNSQGSRYGIQFQPLERLSNSHRALLASEYAREHGAFEAFHRAIFYRVFTAREDIADWAVLRSVAQAVGLDPDGMTAAVEGGVYDNRLEEAQQLAHVFGVDATPTFIINRRYKISGAQPLEMFQRAFQQILQESSPSGDEPSV